MTEDANRIVRDGVRYFVRRRGCGSESGAYNAEVSLIFNEADDADRRMIRSPIESMGWRIGPCSMKAGAGTGFRHLRVHLRAPPIPYG